MILYKKPWVYHILHWLYGVEWGEVVIAWNGNIYASEKLPWHIIDHEKTHLEQQGGFFGSCIFFIRYIVDKRFRYEKELEAYRVQYASFCQIVSRRQSQHDFIVKLAEDLSGPMYGRLVLYGTALKDIRHV